MKKNFKEVEVFGGLYDGGEATSTVDKEAKPASTEAGAKTDKAKPEEKTVAKPEEEQNVPLAALENERLRRQNAEGGIEVLKQHVQTLQGQISAKEEKPDAFASLEDDNVITVREVKALVSDLKASLSKQTNASNTTNDAVVAELQVKVDHPDYLEVINKNLVNVLTAIPQLRTAIASAPEQHRPLLAYTIGTMDAEYKKKADEVAHSEIAKRLQANANKPGSVHIASGAADDTDLAKVIANESQPDFEKRIASVKARAVV